MNDIGYNAKSSKKINRELVLKTIYNNKPISRADIAKHVGLTPASITKIIDEFIKIGLVSEIGREKTSYGRKPVLLEINSERFFIIGIYIGRKKINGVVTNLNAEMKSSILSKDINLDNKIIFKKGCLNLSYLNKEVCKLIDKLIENIKTGKEKIIGIGIAVPGPIGSIGNETIQDDPTFQNNGASLVRAVSKKFKLPVFTDKDSNVSAVGESWFGVGKQFKNFLLVTFGEGIGSGLFLNNRLYVGEDDVVGEIGHTTIDLNGLMCECGNKGCLELFIKNTAMIKKFKELSAKYPNSKLAQLDIDKMEKIYNYRDKKDPVYIEIIDYFVKYMSAGVTTLVNILNPEAVIITTNEMEEIDLDLIINKINKIVQKRIFPILRNKIKIIPGGLKHSQLVGAIGLVLKVFFEFYNK